MELMRLAVHNKILYDKEGNEYDICHGYSHEETVAHNKYKEEQEQKEARKAFYHIQQNQYGKWVFLLYNIDVALDYGIEPANLTKLIYLSTFMFYNNRLLYNNRIPITKKNLQNVLGIGKTAYYKFANEVFDKGLLIEDDKGRLSLNKEIFFRGYMRDVQKYLNENQLDKDIIKLYYNSIREIYTKSKVTEHGKLSYLFQMIPYINIEFNILCHNPFETNFDLIDPMIMEDYCEIIGYSVNNVFRLKNSLKSISIGDTYAFNFVDNGEGLFCCVNPCVFYAGCGDNLDKCESFGKFKNVHKNEKNQCKKTS